MIYGPPDTDRHLYTTTHRGPRPAHRARAVKRPILADGKGGSHGKLNGFESTQAGCHPGRDKKLAEIEQLASVLNGKIGKFLAQQVSSNVTHQKHYGGAPGEKHLGSTPHQPGSVTATTANMTRPAAHTAAKPPKSTKKSNTIVDGTKDGSEVMPNQSKQAQNHPGGDGPGATPSTSPGTTTSRIRPLSPKSYAEAGDELDAAWQASTTCQRFAPQVADYRNTHALVLERRGELARDRLV